jgi:hypothetical protein
MTSRGAPIELDAVGRSIHFLRGVNSRAMMTLPVFYLFLGANTGGDRGGEYCAIEGYPGVVFCHAVRFSSVGTVSLSCRKTFDHGAKGLTGGNFGKSSDETLRGVAEYWSENSGESFQDAFAALNFLRSVFRDYARTDRDLLNHVDPLGRRVGLLKQHADRAAAHLSLQGFEFSILDIAHVVALLTVIGEIIRTFDGPDERGTYFDTLDEASFVAAQRLFPAIPKPRLFQGVKIGVKVRVCWEGDIEQGRETLRRLPQEMGWLEPR